MWLSLSPFSDVRAMLYFRVFFLEAACQLIVHGGAYPDEIAYPVPQLLSMDCR